MATNYNLKLNLISDDSQFSAGFRDANRRLKEHQAKVAQTGESYQSLSKSQKLTANYAREVGVALGKDSKAFKEAAAEAKRYQNEIEKINKAGKLGGAGSSGGAGGLVGSVVGVAMNRILPLMILMEAGKAIQTATTYVVDFGFKLSEVKAVSGATSVEIKKLSEQAISLGEVSQKTAMDITTLQIELSKLGFTAKQIEQATGSILELASATHSDLGEAAKISASTLRAFGLAAVDTRMITDVMAKAFAASSLDIETFTVGMSKVAPVAKAAGFNIKETTAMLGVLQDSGVEASIAGTSLRNIFLILSSQGLKLNDVLDEIEKSTNKNATAQKYFDTRTAAAAITLSESRDKIKQLTEALYDSNGALTEMSNIMENNLQGSINRTKGAWQSFILTVDDGSGTLSTIARLAIDNLTQSIWKMRKALMTPIEKEEMFLNTEATKVVADKLNQITEAANQAEQAGGNYAESRASGIKLAIKDLQMEVEILRDIHKELVKYADNDDDKYDELVKVDEQWEIKRRAIMALKEAMEELKEVKEIIETPPAGGTPEVVKEASLDRMKSIKIETFTLRELEQAYRDTKKAIFAFYEEGLDTSALNARHTALSKQITRVKAGRATSPDGLTVTPRDVENPYAGLPRVSEEVEALNDDLESLTNQAITTTAVLTFSELGEQMAKGEFTWKSFGKNMLSYLGDTLVQLGTLLIAYGVTMDAFKKAFANPWVAIAAGGAAVVIGSAIKAKAGQMGSNTAGGSGGSFTPPSFSANAGYSRYAGVSGHRATGSRIGGGGESMVRFVVKGDDLVAVLKKNEVRKTNMH